jgi:hypothetical protein
MQRLPRYRHLCRDGVGYAPWQADGDGQSTTFQAVLPSVVRWCGIYVLQGTSKPRRAPAGEQSLS